jgi:hypothetical protein
MKDFGKRKEQTLQIIKFLIGTGNESRFLLI